MTSFFYTELIKQAIDMRATQQPSRAAMPGIKLLNSSSIGKPLKPIFNTPNSNPKPTFSSTGQPQIGKPMPNFPYQKPAMKGGLRDQSIASPSATPNMQV